MKFILKILIVYCLITPLFSQNSVSFALATEYYSGQTNYSNATGISVGYMHQLSFPGELGLKLNYNSLSLNVSSPSTNTAVNISIADFYMVYGYNFANTFFLLDLKPVIGAGFKVLNREAFQIDLGALGKETSPEFSKTYFTSFIGLVVSGKITNNFGLFVEPGYSVYDLAKLHSIFSIKGGIDVLIN